MLIHKSVSPYLLAICLAAPAFGKGLDTMQAEGDKPQQTAPTKGWGSESQEGPPAPASNSVPATPGTTPGAAQPSMQTTTAQPTTTIAEAESFYFATSFSWINLSGSKGDWATGATADVETGFRILPFMQKFDLFGTFRYRPVEATVQQDMREYRAIVETYLFGAKVRMGINPRLTVNGGIEVGTSQAHLKADDSIPTVDQSLEKSGVDLSLGGGVSYLVLDKLAVGGKLAVGSGAYKSVQIGVDLRFIL
jgi:hypothetical protein